MFNNYCTNLDKMLTQGFTKKNYRTSINIRLTNQLRSISPKNANLYYPTAVY